MTLTWKFEVDWMNLPLLAWFTNESSRLLAVFTNRGRDKAYNATGREKFPYGIATIVVDNHDRRFDPYYADGPLYLKLLPGRDARLSVSNDGANFEPVFTGYIFDIRPSSNLGETEISLVDGLFYLMKQNCDTSISEVGPLVQEVIEDLLTMSAWPFISAVTTFPFTFPLTLGSLLVETSTDTVVSYNSTPEKTILDALDELAEAFNGNFFTTKAGAFAYDIQDTFRPSSAILLQEDLAKRVDVSMPWDNIYNDIQVDSITTTIQKVSDTHSESVFGPSTFSLLGNEMIQTDAHALDLASSLALYLPEEKYSIKVQIEDNFAHQFQLDLLDKIELVLPYFGIDSYFQINRISHEYIAGQPCITQLVLISDYSFVIGVQTFPFTFPLTL